jgi:hypothetical protein
LETWTTATPPTQWNEEDSFNLAAKAATRPVLEAGSLILRAPVFSELLAFRSKDEAFLDTFLAATGNSADWNLDETIWRIAGRGFHAPAARTRRQREPGPAASSPMF